jgi:hypothetical protein
MTTPSTGPGRNDPYLDGFTTDLVGPLSSTSTDIEPFLLIIIIVVIILTNLVPHHCAPRSAHKRAQPWMTHRRTNQGAAAGADTSSNTGI